MFTTPLPATARARMAYTDLRWILPPELASRVVHDLETARGHRGARGVLEAVPELRADEREAWLRLHGYTKACDTCMRGVGAKERCSVNARLGTVRCVTCALTRGRVRGQA